MYPSLLRLHPSLAHHYDLIKSGPPPPWIGSWSGAAGPRVTGTTRGNETPPPPAPVSCKHQEKHILVRPAATAADLRRLCEKTRAARLQAVCVSPSMVAGSGAEVVPLRVEVVVAVPDLTPAGW